MKPRPPEIPHLYLMPVIPRHRAPWARSWRRAIARLLLGRRSR